MTTDIPVPEVGTIFRGRVIRFLKHGAILEIDFGLKGFLHNSEISWLNRRAKADEVLKIGEELNVAVVKVHRSKGARTYISLGQLQTQENPWETLEEKHPVGSYTKAKVIDFLPFGAIVEFPTGFRALVHDSEISWTERKPKAQELLQLDDEIEVVVQWFDKAKRRIHASHKQAIEDPWATLLKRFPIGAKTTGQVVLVRDFGVFVMLPNGCRGLLHKSRFPPGAPAISIEDRVDVVILEYDEARRRIALGHPSSEV